MGLQLHISLRIKCEEMCFSSQFFSQQQGGFLFLMGISFDEKKIQPQSENKTFPSGGKKTGIYSLLPHKCCLLAMLVLKIRLV